MRGTLSTQEDVAVAPAAPHSCKRRKDAGRLIKTWTAREASGAKSSDTCPCVARRENWSEATSVQDKGAMQQGDGVITPKGVPGGNNHR